MENTNIKIVFTISANMLDFNKITEKIGCRPNYIRKKDEILKNGRIFGHDEWAIETDYEESLDVLIQLNKIVDTILNKSSIIKELCKEFNATCGFLIIINIENGIFPAMYLDSGFINFASSMNAEIGFDIYFYSDNN